MMTTKEFASRHCISESSVKKMCPHIDGAKQCPYCKKWEIPIGAKPIYIPDRRKYKEACRKYCYVMDAIANNMMLHPSLSYISESEIKIIISQLQENDLITTSKIGSEYYEDFRLTLKGLEWKEKKSIDKSKLIIEILHTVNNISSLLKTVIEVAS